jgi:CBS domain-containing protein
MATEAPSTSTVSVTGMRRITVGEVMRRPTTSVETRAHLAAAAYLMKRSGDSALVVTTDDDERRPVAIVTDTDVAEAVASGRNLEETRIAELRTTPPVTVEPGTLVVEAARTMLLQRIQHLPVVEAGRLVGIIDMSDACRGLLERDPAPST